MVVRETLRSYNIVQVRPHQVGDQVDLLEGIQSVPSGMKNIQQADYVLVVHVLQHAKFTIGPFGVDGRLERARQFFDCHLNVVLCIRRRAVS